MTPKWKDVGLRSCVDGIGIRKEDDHWRFFDDNGDFPGRFADREAARNGCWVPASEAERINTDRLINDDDVRACMRQAMDAMLALSDTEGASGARG